MGKMASRTRLGVADLLRAEKGRRALAGVSPAMGACGEERRSTPAACPGEETRRARGLGDAVSHQECVDELGRDRGGRTAPDSSSEFNRPEEETAKLTVIPGTLARFLWGGDRGCRGGSSGGLNLARGGLERRRHDEEDGASAVRWFCWLTEKKKIERDGGAAARGRRRSRVRRRSTLKREGEWLAWWWRVTPGRKRRARSSRALPGRRQENKGTPSVERKNGQAGLLRWRQNGPR
jgi:hypothetical protein